MVAHRVRCAGGTPTGRRPPTPETLEVEPMANGPLLVRGPIRVVRARWNLRRHAQGGLLPLRSLEQQALLRRQSPGGRFPHMTGQSVEVADNPGERRFEASVEGDLAGLLYYSKRPGKLVLVHTEVSDEFGGQGVGADSSQVPWTTSAHGGCRSPHFVRSLPRTSRATTSTPTSSRRSSHSRQPGRSETIGTGKTDGLSGVGASIRERARKGALRWSGPHSSAGSSRRSGGSCS